MHAIAHNKVMIIDSQAVITGSFNFTRAAELRNAENLLIIRSKELAEYYRREWAEHKAHSAPGLTAFPSPKPLDGDEEKTRE